MKNDKTYGILRELAPHTLSRAKTDIYYPNGDHLQPLFVKETDKYILFEKTRRANGSEYYSNAWSDSDYEFIVAKMKTFSEWWNYVEKINSHKVKMRG